MKNTLTKSAQIRPTKKFNTAIKKPETAQKGDVALSPSNKLKTSQKAKTLRSTNPPTTTEKIKKSVANTTVKKKTEIKKIDEKKKSIFKKPEDKTTKNLTKSAKINVKNSISSKKNNMSVSLQKDNLHNQKKFKTAKFQNVNLFNSQKSQKSKTTRKYIDVKNNKSKVKNNDNLRNSEFFNKNESLKINTINSENENNSFVNQGENLQNNNNQENVKNINNENNIPLQNELIKEKLGNEFIKYSQPNGNFQIINEHNPFQEPKLKNKLVENSNYISEKNKNMMRNLLYLLDKKTDDKKNQKNIFRSSINNLDKKEKNKLSDLLFKNAKKMYKMKLQEEVKNISSPNNFKKINPETNSTNYINNTNNINNLNTNNLFELGIFNIEDKYQTMKNKYLMMTSKPIKQSPIYYKDKYFIDYVNGKCPNRAIFEKNMKYDKNIIANNSGLNTNIHHLSKSYDKKFKFMEKNDLSVEKRDDRYLYYNYGFMINNINNKLNGYISDTDFLHTLKKTNSDIGLN